MAGDGGVRELLLRRGGNHLADVVEQLVEERPAVLGLDRLELFDVDVDDADLALLDQHLLGAVEDEGQAGQRGGPVDQQASRAAAARATRASLPASAPAPPDALTTWSRLKGLTR